MLGRYFGAAERVPPGGPSVRAARIAGVERDEGGTPGRRIGVEQLVEPLERNAAKAGDHSFESVRKLGNAVPLLVENSGDQLMELWLEPTGQDYWLRPGEVVVVTSYGEWVDHPFEVAHEPDRVTVWCTSWFATVTDRQDQEVPGAHQRPAGLPRFAGQPHPDSGARAGNT